MSRLRDPAYLVRPPACRDLRDASLRERGDNLQARALEAEWRRRVAKNEARRQAR